LRFFFFFFFKFSHFFFLSLLYVSDVVGPRLQDLNLFELGEGRFCFFLLALERMNECMDGWVINQAVCGEWWWWWW